MLFSIRPTDYFLQIIQSSSPEMLRLAERSLHTYSSEIVGVEVVLTVLVFGMNAHGREVVEGRVVMQVGREKNQVKLLGPPI